MEKITFLKLAEKIIREELRPLTAMEIWQIAVNKAYDKLIGSEGKTPWKTIEAQMYVNVKEQPNSVFIRVGKKPTRFYLRALENNCLQNKMPDDVKLVKEEPKETKKDYNERSLHPLLTYYAYTFMRIHTKTIYHEKSSKKNYNQWIHPDLVGVYFPIGEWQTDVLDFSKEIGASVLKLFSFEMKIALDFSNLRESFFQTVSNSSWANEGYLVATEIDSDEDFLIELKRLSTSFGIGIIKLDTADPNSSQIIYPARYKDNLDWDSMNKLAEENPDFRNFLKRVRDDLRTKEVIRERYDKVVDVDKLII